MTSVPQFVPQSRQLMERLQQMSEPEVAATMGISAKLASQTHQRHQELQIPASPGKACQALLLFKGDVYETLAADQLDDEELLFAQQHLGILSGLYGLLRPLDLIMPHRLEMGLPFPTPAGSNLYEFWGDTITDLINRELAGQPEPLLVNLASDEYFKVIRPPKLNGRLLKISFKENQAGRLRVVAIHAKRARGLMARFIITNRITAAAKLRDFDLAGYRFDGALSTDDEWLFCRPQ